MTKLLALCVELVIISISLLRSAALRRLLMESYMILSQLQSERREP